MKSPGQTAVLILVVMGLVGGVTFIRNWVTNQPLPSTQGIDDSSKEIELTFPTKVFPGVPEFEVTGTGFCDFWFENKNDFDVEIGLDQKSCKCSKVQVLTLDSEMDRQIRDRLAPTAAGDISIASSGLLGLLGHLATVAEQNNELSARAGGWNSLLEANATEGIGQNVVPVPACGAGWVRLGWEGRKIGPLRLKADLWVQKRGKPVTRGGFTSLEVPLWLVPPIMGEKATIKLPRELKPGDQETIEFLCWSSTRAGFHLSCQEESGDPCFICKCVPLSSKEIDEAFDALYQRTKTRILCAYKVNVTVSEHLPTGQQLDLGPLQHKLVLTTDQRDYYHFSCRLEGMVRGEITVGTDEFRDNIRFNSFQASRGAVATAPIESNQPGLQLELESKTPDYLVVNLKPSAQRADGRSRWELEVSVPPNQAIGRLPSDSAVVLKTKNKPPRKIRIPVLGRASVP